MLYKGNGWYTHSGFGKSLNYTPLSGQLLYLIVAKRDRAARVGQTIISYNLIACVIIIIRLFLYLCIVLLSTISTVCVCICSAFERAFISIYSENVVNLKLVDDDTFSINICAFMFLTRGL